MKAAKVFLPAGAAGAVAGVALVVVGNLVGGPSAKASDAPEATAAAMASAPPNAGAAVVAATTGATPSATATAATDTYKVGDRVSVDWKGSTYPASIIAVMGIDSYKVHYDGYAASWDEVIGRARIKRKL
jgi:hypothetical protein